MSDRNDEKPEILISKCIDRRLGEFTEGIVRAAKAQGYDVLIWSTPGGDVNPVKEEMKERIATGRVKVLLGIPHHDCKWVALSAEVLYDGKKVSKELDDSIRLAFEGFRPSKKAVDDRQILLAEMELFHFSNQERIMKEMAGGRIDVSMEKPNARALDKEAPGKHHTHDLVLSEPSGLVSTELAMHAEVEAHSMYEARSTGYLNKRLAAEVLSFSEVKSITFIATKDGAARAEEQRSTLTKEPFVDPKFVWPVVVYSGERTKLKT